MHGELAVSGSADLAHEEQGQGRLQRAGHLGCHRYAATRQGRHDRATRQSSGRLDPQEKIWRMPTGSDIDVAQAASELGADT